MPPAKSSSRPQTVPRVIKWDLHSPPSNTTLNLILSQFHLRAYCVASGALSLFLYDRILALFSSVPYESPSPPGGTATQDLAAHLTNTSLQKDKGEEFVRLFDELVGCRVMKEGASTIHDTTVRRGPRRMMGQAMDPDALREQRATQEAERTQAGGVFTAEDLEDIKSQMSEALSETFKAALEMSVHFQVRPLIIV